MGTYTYFVEHLIQYVTTVDGTAHPGAEQAFRSSVVSDVLSAGGVGVAEATDARARVFVALPGVVREVVALDHILRMSTGGFLECGMHAEWSQAVVFTSVVVQGEQPLLRVVQEDLTPSAPAGIASTRRLGRRIYTDGACGRKKDGDGDHQQIPHEVTPPLVVSAFRLVSLLLSLFADFAICGRSITLHIALHVSICIVSGQRHFPPWHQRHRLLRSFLLTAGSIYLCELG